MPYTTLPIVGAFHHPPAQTLLDAIAVGTPLTLLAEPENQADAFAVAVWLKSANIPPAAHEKLETELLASGYTLSLVLDQEWWHVGYIPRNFARPLRETGVVTDSLDGLAVTFATDPTGKPRVRFSSPVL